MLQAAKLLDRVDFGRVHGEILVELDTSETGHVGEEVG